MEKKSFLSECKQSSSCFSLFALFNLFLLGFCRWVSSARIFISKFLLLLHHHQRITHQKQNLNKPTKEQEEHDDVVLSKEDAETVMRSLGLTLDKESEDLQENYSSKEISSLFEDKEASFEEVKQAFDVFDENRDGFIDAKELQTVLKMLGFKEGSCFENCLVMIRSLDGYNEDRIDFNQFVKFMEDN
ncbi:unnamed protein product [Cochlearia groenlandica]